MQTVSSTRGSVATTSASDPEPRPPEKRTTLGPGRTGSLTAGGPSLASLGDKVEELLDDDVFGPVLPARAVAVRSHLLPQGGVVLKTAHRLDQFAVGRKQHAAVRCVHNLGERSNPPRDYGRLVSKRLDQDDAKGFVAG